MDPPLTPPNSCVTAKSGKVLSSKATTKKSRPSRLPRTICALESGVVSMISHVRGLDSCAIAPAMNTGVSRQIASTWP